MSAATIHLLNITMLGSGNVATHLSQAFAQAGHKIQTIYSRQLVNAQLLAGEFPGAIATDSLNLKQIPESDIYIICVTDAAVASVMEQAQFPPHSLVVHTSGSLPVTVLTGKSEINIGVFYPVQTFSKNQPVNLRQTPIAIEALTETAKNKLEILAQSISSSVFNLSSQDRKILHLAAVFACNFTNHLWGISQELLQAQGLNITILKPLIEATIQKALSNNPFTVQTGPAIRGDHNILEAQQEILNQQPNYQKIYQALTESIQTKK